MKAFIFCLLTLILISNLSQAQNKKIIKIIDSNLYMLEDSTYIKLAGIDVPSKDNPNKYLNEIADEVYEYAYNNFLQRPLEILYAGEAGDYFNSKLVLINRIFLLSKMNYNKHFVERGFGKFINFIQLIKMILKLLQEKR